MPIIYPENVKTIARILKSAGHSCYAVGGCVRDSIMGRTPNDWDVATSARPDEMLSIFNLAGVRTIPTGLKHGTVTLLIGGETYECTSFRIDGSYTDARHPDAVTFTHDVSEDLRRRDFTVNAMAGDPLCSDDNGVIDLFGGKNDIKSRLIRCVGDAETRFSEDALRILRAVRFATVLDFDIEENTKNAAIKLRDTLAAVSIERRVVELKKILLSPHADRGVKLLYSMGMLPLIHEGLKLPCVSLASLPVDFPCRMAAVLGIDSAPSLSCLKLSRQEETEIKLYCSSEGYSSEKSEINARRLLSSRGICAEGSALLRGDHELCAMIASERKKDRPLTISSLAVNGNDLIAQGIPQRKLGSVLTRLLDEVIIAPEKNQKQALLALAKSIYLTGEN